jgi:ferric-dicitrate binding protein FerR (iron transport regulator)
VTDDDYDFDDQLTARFGNDDLPDDGFSARVVTRLERHRRRRQWIAAGLCAAALLPVLGALLWLPGPVMTADVVTPINVAATLILATVCSVIWIATEASVDLRELD